MPSTRAPASRSAALFLVISTLATPSLVGCASAKPVHQRPVQVPAAKRDKQQQPLHLRQPNY
jgi:hypothetical protein